MNLPLKHLDRLDKLILVMLISWGVAVVMIFNDLFYAFWLIISANVLLTAYLAIKLLKSKR
jgi:hypothetical protein